ncbi:MAG: hypothetical protein H0W50_01675 [Parachlamydiaceae bacterium]|nr:hypothetical protein [Parachlamydiaceae bacterium]
MGPIKNFLLKDHLPTQIFLSSIPVVNVFLRIFQSSHSLDNVENISSFENKKINFKFFMFTALTLQISLLIIIIYPCIVAPQIFPIFTLTNKILFGLLLSNWITDSLCRTDMFAPSKTGAINVKGW